MKTIPFWLCTPQFSFPTPESATIQMSRLVGKASLKFETQVVWSGISDVEMVLTKQGQEERVEVYEDNFS